MSTQGICSILGLRPIQPVRGGQFSSWTGNDLDGGDVRNDHELAGVEEVRWGDIAPYRFITVGRLSGNRIIMDAALADLKVRPRWFYEVQHLSTSLGLVEAGLGVAAVPRLAAPTGHHPVLVVRPLVEPVVTRIMGIIRRHGTTLSPAAQQFHQLLKERWGTV